MQYNNLKLRAKISCNFSYADFISEIEDFKEVFKEYEAHSKELVSLSDYFIGVATNYKARLVQGFQKSLQHEKVLAKQYREGEITYEEYFFDVKDFIKACNQHAMEVIENVEDAYKYLYAISTIDRMVYDDGSEKGYGEFAVCLTPPEIVSKRLRFGVIQMTLHPKKEEESK